MGVNQMKKTKAIINIVEEGGWKICGKNKEKLYIKGYFYNKSYKFLKQMDLY